MDTKEYHGGARYEAPRPMRTLRFEEQAYIRCRTTEVCHWFRTSDEDCGAALYELGMLNMFEYYHDPMSNYDILIPHPDDND